MAEPHTYEPDYGSEVEPDAFEPLSDQDVNRAVAEYLADMIGQLEQMARSARLDLLVYLLSMARAEAQVNAVRTDAPRIDA